MFSISTVRKQLDIAVGVPVGIVVFGLAKRCSISTFVSGGSGVFSALFARESVLSFQSISSPYFSKNFMHMTKNVGYSVGGVVSVVPIALIICILAIESSENEEERTE